jgi:type III restriction enzyme
MALHKNFPNSPHAVLDPDIRWFPADEALRETSIGHGGHGHGGRLNM